MIFILSYWCLARSLCFDEREKFLTAALVALAQPLRDGRPEPHRCTDLQPRDEREHQPVDAEYLRAKETSEDDCRREAEGGANDFGNEDDDGGLAGTHYDNLWVLTGDSSHKVFN